jgi:hypothetical protein
MRRNIMSKKTDRSGLVIEITESPIVSVELVPTVPQQPTLQRLRWQPAPGCGPQTYECFSVTVSTPRTPPR